MLKYIFDVWQSIGAIASYSYTKICFSYSIILTVRPQCFFARFALQMTTITFCSVQQAQQKAIEIIHFLEHIQFH